MIDDGPVEAPFERIAGDAATPRGFAAGAATCGLKVSGNPDVALVASDRDASAAGVFTRNAFAAAPVRLCRAALAASGGRARAVVANSGCANAATGPAGDEAARAMQDAAAAAVGCSPEHVLVLSTGVIGQPLDVERVRRGIAMAAGALDARGGGPAAAEAIMTTDTRPKTAARRVRLAGGEVLLGGMAKGAGMIHPDMATLLAVVTSDAARAPADLAADLRAAADASFNRISIDGDTSTNDSLIALANGASGVAVDAGSAADVAAWRAALTDLCRDLAQQIVRDGEGVTKFVAIEVAGAADDADAHRVASAVATSPLVKTAFAGGDPNWGRILAAAGRSGARVDPERTSLAFAPGAGDGTSAVDGTSRGEGAGPALALVAGGLPTDYDEDAAAAILAGDAFRVLLDLGLGEGAATVWTGDLTAEYVRINADYRT